MVISAPIGNHGAAIDDDYLPVHKPASGRGEDPKGIIRDPAKAKNIELPTAERDLLVSGASKAEFFAHPFFAHHMHEFLFQAGQPPEIWTQFCEAMGLDPARPLLAPETTLFGVVPKPMSEPTST